MPYATKNDDRTTEELRPLGEVVETIYRGHTHDKLQEEKQQRCRRSKRADNDGDKVYIECHAGIEECHHNDRYDGKRYKEYRIEIEARNGKGRYRYRHDKQHNESHHLVLSEQTMPEQSHKQEQEGYCTAEYDNLPHYREIFALCIRSCFPGHYRLVRFQDAVYLGGNYFAAIYDALAGLHHSLRQRYLLQVLVPHLLRCHTIGQNIFDKKVVKLCHLQNMTRIGIGVCRKKSLVCCLGREQYVGGIVLATLFCNMRIPGICPVCRAV